MENIITKIINIIMKNKIIFTGMILILIGAFLPAIRIANENISFIKENGILTIILVLSMIILTLLNFKQLLYIPSVLSLAIIGKFIVDNKERIKNINELYNSFARYQYGLVVMILGNIIILVVLTLTIVDTKILKEKTKMIRETTIKNIKALKENIIKLVEQIKLKTQNLIKKIKINKQKTHETTKDGKIKFNKITVAINQENKKKKTLKQKLTNIIEKLKRNPSKNLTITKFNETKEKQSYQVQVIDIKKWTRSDICCSNCGATVHTTSEYCFLCDCKIKLKQEKEQTL